LADFVINKTETAPASWMQDFHTKIATQAVLLNFKNIKKGIFVLRGLDLEARRRPPKKSSN
jgi:hypothetical protein